MKGFFADKQSAGIALLEMMNLAAGPQGTEGVSSCAEAF